MEPVYKVFPVKDKSSDLDYLFDWAALKNGNGLTNWLKEGETITEFEVTTPDGIVKANFELVNDATSIVVWLSDGTENTNYLVSCSIVTNLGRKDKRSAVLPVGLR